VESHDGELEVRPLFDELLACAATELWGRAGRELATSGPPVELGALKRELAEVARVLRGRGDDSWVVAHRAHMACYSMERGDEASRSLALAACQAMAQGCCELALGGTDAVCVRLILAGLAPRQARSVARAVTR